MILECNLDMCWHTLSTQQPQQCQSLYFLTVQAFILLVPVSHIYYIRVVYSYYQEMCIDPDHSVPVLSEI